MPDWDDERDLVRKQKQKSSCWITVRVAWEYSRTVAGRLLSAETSGTGGVAQARAEQQQIIAVHVEKLGNLGCMLICCRYSSVRWPESSLHAQHGTFAF